MGGRQIADIWAASSFFFLTVPLTAGLAEALVAYNEINFPQEKKSEHGTTPSLHLLSEEDPVLGSVR